LPDLGLGKARIAVSVWLTTVGSEVVEGDRLLQVVAGEVSVDLPAPATGRLAKQYVLEDDEVEVGQVLGAIERKDEG